jgi:hypothetical protein
LLIATTAAFAHPTASAVFWALPEGELPEFPLRITLGTEKRLVLDAEGQRLIFGPGDSLIVTWDGETLAVNEVAFQLAESTEQMRRPSAFVVHYGEFLRPLVAEFTSTGADSVEAWYMAIQSFNDTYEALNKSLQVAYLAFEEQGGTFEEFASGVHAELLATGWVDSCAVAVDSGGPYVRYWRPGITGSARADLTGDLLPLDSDVRSTRTSVPIRTLAVLFRLLDSELSAPACVHLSRGSIMPRCPRL